jgi:hypothetical protein
VTVDRFAAAAPGSPVTPSVRLGEAAGELVEVTGADQLVHGGVIAWRQRPVVAGCVAAPDPPLRVLLPEPVKSGSWLAPLRPAARR